MNAVLMLESGEESEWNEISGTNDKARLDNIAALPSCRSLELEILAWMRPIVVLVLAHVGIRIFDLIEISEGVIDFTMLALVGTD
jgi:hypothetical protein